MSNKQLDIRASPAQIFLAAGSEMGRLVVSHDWSTTPLGPLESWPDTLIKFTSLLLRSPAPLLLLWGRDGIMIYNDAYAAIADERHPAILGRKVQEGWPEAADFAGRALAACWSGDSLSYRDQEFSVNRAGHFEQVWCNLDFSPLTNEAGETFGVLVVLAETSDKVRAQRKLAAQKDRLHRMFEQAPGMIALVRGPEHVFELANSAYQQMVGQRDLIGLPIRDALPEVEGQGFFDWLEQAYTSGKAHVGKSTKVLLQRAPSGPAETRYIDFVLQPIFQADGSVSGVFIDGYDVTALYESEARFRTITNAVPQMVWSSQPNGYHDYYNQQWYDFTGVPAGSTDGEGWKDIFHPDDQQHAWEVWHRCLATGRPYEIHYRLRHRSGAYRWVLGRALPVRDDAGKIIRWMGTCTDIQDQKTAEEERLRASERMTLAVQAAGLGIFEVDLDSGRITWDARMKELFGLVADFQPSLESVAELLHPDDRDLFLEQFDPRRWKDATGQESLQAEYRLIWHDNSIHYLGFLGRVSRFSFNDSLLLIGICWDVTESRRLEQQLTHQASHDTLTGLLNRFEFERRLAEAQRELYGKDQYHTVCFIDLDRFKFINDTFGHAAGDALLKELAGIMQDQVRASDVLARIGGDEFGLLLPLCPVSQAAVIAQNLIQSVEEFAFHWGGRDNRISASAGIATLTADSAGIDEVMSQADMACYAAKHSGRSRFSIYHSSQSEAGAHHHLLRTAASVREALKTGRFCLYVQPVVDITSTTARAAYHELLVRMLDNQGNNVLPDVFIPAAEHYGLVGLIDRWVLNEVLVHQAQKIQDQPGLKVAVNLSAQSLNDPAFLPFINELLRQSPLAPERIHFEITESAAVTHLEAAVKTIHSLRTQGCLIALDDFGSGLSSFKYLKEFQIDYLKIDGSFICNLKPHSIDLAIVESIHGIATWLGAKTVAEYVESEELLFIVRDLGIPLAQGYGIARPVALKDVI